MKTQQLETIIEGLDQIMVLEKNQQAYLEKIKKSHPSQYISLKNRHQKITKKIDQIKRLINQ